MSKLDFDGRVAVVTGAGRGLGRAYALLLGELGAKVVVNDLGGSTAGTGLDPAPAESVAAQITEAGGAAIADPSDGSTVDGGPQVVDAAVREVARAPLLGHNARHT